MSSGTMTISMFRSDYILNNPVRAGLPRHKRAGVLGAALVALHELEPSTPPPPDNVTQRLPGPKPVSAEP